MTKIADEEKVLAAARTAYIGLLQARTQNLIDLRNSLCKDVSRVGQPHIRRGLNEVFTMAGKEFDHVEEAGKAAGKALRGKRANVRRV